MEIKPSEDGACSVAVTETEKVKYDVAVENKTLRITVRDERGFWDLFTFLTQKLTVTVLLPKAGYESLFVEGSTGDVEIAGPFDFGDAPFGENVQNEHFHRTGPGARGDFRRNV